MITPAQIRAARGLLSINQSQLAARAKVSPATITRIESGENGGFAVTLAKIERALKAAGIRFTDTGVERA